MHTLDETLALLGKVKTSEESWPEFVRRCGIKSYTSTQLERIVTGDQKRGPLRYKLDALYDELHACHEGTASKGPAHSTGPPGGGGMEDFDMDPRRQRIIEHLAKYILDTPDDRLDGVWDAMVEGAIQARRSLLRRHASPPGRRKTR